MHSAAASAPAPRKTPRVNVGREPTSVSARAAGSDAAAMLHDRVERLQAENLRLKQERNEQDQLIRDLKTKFRRLTRDLKANGTDVDAIMNEPLHPHNVNSAVDPTHEGSGVLAAKLAQITAQRDKFQSELAEAKKLLRLRALPGSATAASNAAATQHHHTSPGRGVQSAQALLGGGAGSGHLHSHPPPGAWDQHRDVAHSGNAALLQNSINEIETLRQQNAALHGQLQQLLSENDRMRDVSDQLRQQLLTATAAAAAASPGSRPGTGGSIYNTAVAGGGALPGASPLASGRLGLPSERRLETELQRLREKVMSDAIEIDSLTRERDMLRVQARSGGSGASDGGAGNVGVDPQMMLELQRGISEKTTQLTVLANKFTHAQGQVRTLQLECDRLVEELRTLHTSNADIKRNMFELEHEKFQMQIRCDRVADLESTLQIKTEELIKCEQELLRMVDRLQSTARDTEASVRKECAGRTAELELMREQAEAERRQKERDNFVLMQQLAESRRHVESLKEDAQMLKKEIVRLQDEKHEMQQRNVLLGSAGLDVDDDIHKAVAMVGLKRKMAGATSGGSGGGGGVDLAKLWEGLEWNEGWELAKLRESLAQAALDMELAETRCRQLQESATSKETLLRDISAERDVLLDENIELRQRISGIQTAFIKQQLEGDSGSKGGAVGAAANGGAASIVVNVTKISCDQSLTRCDDGSTFSPTMFLTLDALEDFETVVSENFYDICGELHLRFRFDNVPVTPSTIDMLQSAAFVFQLHQSFGLESQIAAVGSLPASQLLRCRDGSTVVTDVSLCDANGQSIGTITVSINISSLFITMLLNRPLQPGTLSAEAVRAALLQFRGVRALRVVVRSASGLLATPATPSPYVFYTCTSGSSACNFIADTVVTTRSRAITADPQFDADPVDHACVVDREFVYFLQDAVINFVVFDHRATNVESNLGVAAVPLKKMLASPTTTIVATEKLHPQGTLSIDVAWVR